MDNISFALSDLSDADGRKRLRAIYIAGIQAQQNAIPQLQQMATNDDYVELRQAAQAAIQYIQGSASLDDVADARADYAWTQQFLQFLMQSSNFSPQDIEDLAQAVSQQSAEIVKAAEMAAKAQAEREAYELEAGQTYEMLWNCKTCLTKGLLGVTHRFCPNCGTAQKPEWRYFPEPGQYKKLVNHVYQGVDVTCPACGTLNSGSATFCVNCGADLATGEKAQIISDDIVGSPHDFAEDQWQAEKLLAEQELAERKKGLIARNKRKFWMGGIGATLIAVLGGVYGIFFMRIAEEAVIAQHEWQSVYQVEEYRTVRDGREWPAPSGARNVRQETRTRRVPDGQDCREVCSNQRIDQGDGSFRVERVCRNECTTRYRNETYLYCTYDVDRWVDVDEEKEATWAIAKGNDTNPYFPDISNRNVPKCGDAPNRLGQFCWEKQEQTLMLILERENGEEATCEIEDINVWRSWQDGDRVKVNFTFFSRLRDRALCDEMELIQ